LLWGRRHGASEVVELGSKVAGLVWGAAQNAQESTEDPKMQTPKDSDPSASEIGSVKLGVCRLWLGPSG
jgi:hypothetical protein